LPGWGGMPAPYYRDAFVVGVGGSLTLLGLTRLSELAARIWPVLQPSFPAALPTGLDFLWPAVHALSGAVTGSFMAVGILALAVGFASNCIRSPWVQAALAAAWAVLLAPVGGSAGNFIEKALVVFVSLGLIWWATQRIVRFNLLGYFLAVLLVSLASSAVELLRQPNSFFRVNGWVVVVTAAVLLLWPLVKWHWGTQSQTSDLPGALQG
jgi:hypothetical protein